MHVVQRRAGCSVPISPPIRPAGTLCLTCALRFTQPGTLGGAGCPSSSHQPCEQQHAQATASAHATPLPAPQVMLCLGMFAAALCDYALRDVAHGWRWMVGIPAVAGAVMGLSPFVLPESPRWLVMRSNFDHALAILQTVIRAHSPDEVRPPGTPGCWHTMNAHIFQANTSVACIRDEVMM
jgi:hypothetical protein